MMINIDIHEWYTHPIDKENKYFYHSYNGRSDGENVLYWRDYPNFKAFMIKYGKLPNVYNILKKRRNDKYKRVL